MKPNMILDEDMWWESIGEILFYHLPNYKFYVFQMYLNKKLIEYNGSLEKVKKEAENIIGEDFREGLQKFYFDYQYSEIITYEEHVKAFMEHTGLAMNSFGKFEYEGGVLFMTWRNVYHVATFQAKSKGLQRLYNRADEDDCYNLASDQNVEFWDKVLNRKLRKIDYMGEAMTLIAGFLILDLVELGERKKILLNFYELLTKYKELDNVISTVKNMNQFLASLMIRSLIKILGEEEAFNKYTKCYFEEEGWSKIRKSDEQKNQLYIKKVDGRAGYNPNKFFR